jgi:hypothetical protein
MQTFAGISQQTAAIMAFPNYPLGVDRVRLQRVADAMHRFGLLTQAFDVRQMVG